MYNPKYKYIIILKNVYKLSFLCKNLAINFPTE